MSDSPSKQHDSERLEEIVSYLDGELSGDESARVEQRLATDEDFRQELQSIDRAWSALDELPLETVEDRFAKTTMELVVQTAREEVEQKTIALPIQRRNQTFKKVLLITTAALLGCLVFRVAWRNPNRPLLADLEVIQNVDIYSQFQEVDFLRQLNDVFASEAWPEDSSLSTPVGDASVIAVSLDDPEVWLENLAEEERISLRAKYNRFRVLPGEQQDRLRKLHAEISQDNDAEQLQQTMVRYQDWLGHLSASEQYELRELSSQQRVTHIKRMLHQEAKWKSLELSKEELKSLFDTVSPLIEEKRKKFIRQMSEQDRKYFDRLSSHEKRWFMMSRIMRASRREGEQIHRLLQDSISEEKLQAFEELSTDQQRRRFAGWMWEAIDQEGPGHKRAGRRGPRELSEQDLEKFFSEELDAASIELMLALPREKMQQQLERKARGDQRRGWEGPRDWDHGPPGRPGPPHPGEGRRRDGPDVRERRPGPPDGRPPHRRPPHDRPERDFRPPPEDV